MLFNFQLGKRIILLNKSKDCTWSRNGKKLGFFSYQTTTYKRPDRTPSAVKASALIVGAFCLYITEPIANLKSMWFR